MGTQSTPDLHQQLLDRDQRIRHLLKKRERLIHKISLLESELMHDWGFVLGITRPKNDCNLADAIANVLKGNTMHLNEIIQAVIDSGYKTTSHNFRTMVNQRLASDDRFIRVGCGVYTSKA